MRVDADQEAAEGMSDQDVRPFNSGAIEQRMQLTG